MPELKLVIQDSKFGITGNAVLTLDIWAPYFLTIRVLTFEQVHFTTFRMGLKKLLGWVTNSVNPDQMPRLRCLIKVYTVCLALSVPILKVSALIIILIELYISYLEGTEYISWTVLSILTYLRHPGSQELCTSYCGREIILQQIWNFFLTSVP